MHLPRHVEVLPQPIYVADGSPHSSPDRRFECDAPQWAERNDVPLGAHADWPVVLPSEPPIRVLVIDDNRTSRHLLHTLLTRWGMEVQSAFDGLDGWETLHRIPFDMVVSDIEMPRWNGNQLVESMRRSVVPSLRTMPVILISSVSPDTVVREFSHLDKLYFIQRPVEIVELVDMLRLATGRS